MAQRAHPPSAVRTAVVWEALRTTLAERMRASGRRQLDVVDAGGGTGGFAVPLAQLGHRITVVDPSPDSLAATQRRAAEAGVCVHTCQGDVTDLLDVVGADSADLVLCHSVLEYVDDPAAALGVLATVVHPGGALSVLVANPVATAVHRAVAGRLSEARRLLTDPAGTWGERDPVPRRFTLAAIIALIEKAGLRADGGRGVRVFADLVPGEIIDAEPGAVDTLVALEAIAARHPALREIATQLHVLARREGG